MADPEHVRIAANFGLFMLAAGGLELLSGTAISRSGLFRKAQGPGTFYTLCGCHLFVGAFCYFGQFFAQVPK